MFRPCRDTNLKECLVDKESDMSNYVQAYATMAQIGDEIL